jgi:hypothetical protein
MTLGFSTAIRNARADATDAEIGNGAKLRFYDGTRPGTPGGSIAGATLIAELTLGSPAFGVAASGVLTASTIAGEDACLADGTIDFFRVVKSDGTTFCMDGSVTVIGGGGDIELVTLTAVTGQPLDLSAWTITENND